MNPEQFWPILDLEYQDAKGDDNGKPKMIFKALKIKSAWAIFYGETGSGKTEYAKKMIRKHEGWEITRVADFFNMIAGLKRSEGRVFYDVIKRNPIMVLDDVGFEQKVIEKDYGRIFPRELMKDILFERAEAKLKTIITTNLDPSDEDEEKDADCFRGRYGDRIYSRAKGLATWVSFKGDRRQGVEPEINIEAEPGGGE